MANEYEKLDEKEFRRLQISAFHRLSDTILEMGGGTFSTMVERIDGVRWVTVAHHTEGIIGKFLAEEL